MPHSDLRNQATVPTVREQKAETPRALQPRWERVSSHSSITNAMNRRARKIQSAGEPGHSFQRASGQCGNAVAADSSTETKRRGLPPMPTEGGRPTSWCRGHQGLQLGEARGQVLNFRLLPGDRALLFLDELALL